jgi:hypothetical protein
MGIFIPLSHTDKNVMFIKFYKIYATKLILGYSV